MQDIFHFPHFSFAGRSFIEQESGEDSDKITELQFIIEAPFEIRGIAIDVQIKWRYRQHHTSYYKDALLYRERILRPVSQRYDSIEQNQAPWFLTPIGRI